MDRWVDGLRGALERWRHRPALNGDVARALRDWRGAATSLQAHVRLRPQETCRVRTGLTVCEAAAPETIHRVGSDGGRALSLHVYARPLDSFLVFDENDGSCRRVGLPR